MPFLWPSLAQCGCSYAFEENLPTAHSTEAATASSAAPVIARVLGVDSDVLAQLQKLIGEQKLFEIFDEPLWEVLENARDSYKRFSKTEHFATLAKGAGFV